jgi:sugar lactone lactonase YvrE
MVWGQGGSFTTGLINITATGLNHPNAVAVDSSGNLYVADYGDNRVLYYLAGSTTATGVYGQGGDFTTRTTGTSATALNTPSSLALDGSGNLYVADTGNNRVLFFPAGSTTATRVYGQSGSFTTNTAGVSATALNGPAGVALDSSGNLYVADTGNYRVLYFPAGSTTATRVYGQSNFTSSGPGTSATALSYVYAVTVDSGGNLYAADGGNNRVVYFPAGSTTATRVYGQSNFTSSASSTTASGLNDPVGVVVDSFGDLFVSDLLNNRVLYYPVGATTPTLVYGQSNFTSSSRGLSATKFYFPYGLAVDSSGNLYVSDYQDNRVLEFLMIAPTSYTLTGPSGGPLNTASTNFTVTPNANYTGTITISPSGGGLSTPIVLTFTNSAVAQTFTITPTTLGPVTLTPSNSGSLSNPSALTYSTPPAAPSIVSVTPGNGQVAVAFTANATGGSAITGYTATCGASSISGSASPIVVTGLTNGTGYTCTVTATNSFGSSAASTASALVTPTVPASYTLTGPSGGALNTASTNFTVTPNANYTGTVTISPSGGGLSTPIVLTFTNSAAAQTFTIAPAAVGPVTLTPANSGLLTNPPALTYSTPPGAPTILSVTPGNGQISVGFTANATGGSAITGYTATCGTSTISGSTSPIVVTGLTNGTGYTCTAIAVNSFGASAASAASALVTPGAPSFVTPPAATFVWGQGGSFTTNANGTSTTALNYPQGIAVDSVGNVYVADSGNNRVLYFPTGSATATRRQASRRVLLARRQPH